MHCAASSGIVELREWVFDHGYVPTQSAMEAAVKGGHLHVLDWLSSKGCKCTNNVLWLAVRAAGVPVVAWCLDHHPHPPDVGGNLALSSTNVHGCEVFVAFTAHPQGSWEQQRSSPPKGSPPPLSTPTRWTISGSVL